MPAARPPGPAGATGPALSPDEPGMLTRTTPSSEGADASSGDADWGDALPAQPVAPRTPPADTPDAGGQSAAGNPPAAPALGESMVKPQHRSGLNVDLAVQEHRHKTKYREASGYRVQSAHMLNSSSARDVAEYVRDAALTVLMPRELHKAFDDYWKRWARERVAEAAQDEPVRVTVAEWEQVLNDAADSVAGLRGRSADTMSFLIRTEIYQTLRLEPDQLLRVPYS